MSIVQLTKWELKHVNRSNSKNESRHNRNSMLEWQDPGRALEKTMKKLQHLSQTYMNSAARYIDPSSAQICIILSERALEYMLKALYMKANHHILPPHALSLHDLVQLTAKDSIPDLDTVMLLYSIHFLASCQDVSFIRHTHVSHLTRLLTQVDDVLTRLSASITSNPLERYRSIL